jgi:hypothetical protein
LPAQLGRLRFASAGIYTVQATVIGAHRGAPTCTRQWLDAPGKQQAKIG